MNKKDKDFNIISHIMEYCIEIEDTVNFFGDAFERFSSDKIYRNAATMCILQIGKLGTQFCNNSRMFIKPLHDDTISDTMLTGMIR